MAGYDCHASDSSLLVGAPPWNFPGMSLRFEVLETLESHQRASLLKVRDLQSGQEAYLRRYHAEAEEIEAQRELLTTLKGLEHPNLERFHEVGTDEESLFAIVDPPSGKSLAELFKEGPLSEAEFEQVARQIMAGLIVLHERGIPHLSLRPEVIRVQRPVAGLLDVRVGGFGEGFGRKSETEPADAAAYRCTAPEQWRGDAVGRRTDVYAMGCIFYESIAGKPPFRPDSINSLRAAHLSHDFVPLAKEAPQVKRWISAWVVQLLDPDMNSRPKDAAAAMKLFNLREHLLPPDQGQAQPGLPPGYGASVTAYPYHAPIPVATPIRDNSGMVPLTRAVTPAPASSTTAFQPVMLAHKTAAVFPRPGKRAVPHIPLTPTPRVSPHTKIILIGAALLAVIAAIALLLMMPAKPVMAPVAERLAMRLPVLNGLQLHLDAARQNTTETSITNRVKRWSDAEDKTRYAAPPETDKGPTVSSGTLHELPVLDFGPYRSEHWMEFKAANGTARHITNIRTVFWVMHGSGFLLSDDQTTDFHRGGDEGSPDARIFGGLLSDAVKQGKLRLNGSAVKPETALPKAFSLISLVTAAPATASRLCKDRMGNEGRMGGQEIAELVIYDRALSDAEVKQVETYLRTKWLAP